MKNEGLITISIFCLEMHTHKKIDASIILHYRGEKITHGKDTNSGNILKYQYKIFLFILFTLFLVY